MRKEEIMKLENSELMCYLFIKRDNLISIRRAMNDNKEDKDLQELFDTTEKDYTALLCEVYRRMKKWALMIILFMSVAYLSNIKQ